MNEAFNIVQKFFRENMKLNSKVIDTNGNLTLVNEKITTIWKQYLEAHNNNPDMQGEILLSNKFKTNFKVTKSI